MTKKLYKSRNDKAISGVCAGLADYLDIDVIVVRLLAVIFCFMSFGTALIVYIIAAVVMPEEPTVRMNDGTKRPVYETTYEYRNEDGPTAGDFTGNSTNSNASAGSSTNSGTAGTNGSYGTGTAGTNGSPGNAEFYTEGAGSAGQTAGADYGQKQNNEAVPRKKSSGVWIAGLFLIGMGAYMILELFFPWISWRIFGAVILILAGLVILVKR